MSGWERSATDVEAQECYGQRVIIRARCRHRLPCGDATVEDGHQVHLDGLVFATEAAAQRFDRAQLVPERASFQIFASWDAARTWLRSQPE